MIHSFDTEHARLYGMEEAVMIHALQWWIRKNQAEGRNSWEGRTWSFNSYAALAKEFDYWSDAKVKRVMTSLVTQGVLIVQQRNKSSGDLRNWYAFKDENVFLPHKTIPSDGGRKRPMGDGIVRSSKEQLGTPVNNNSYLGEEDAPAAPDFPQEQVTPELQALRLLNAGGDKIIYAWNSETLSSHARSEWEQQIGGHFANGREVTLKDLEGALARAEEEYRAKGDRRRKTMTWLYHALASELRGDPPPNINPAANGKRSKQETPEEFGQRMAREIAAKKGWNLPKT